MTHAITILLIGLLFDFLLLKYFKCKTNNTILNAKLDESDRTMVYLKRTIEHWKANHYNQVEASKLLKERLDMPLDRIEAYKMVQLLIHEKKEIEFISNSLSKTIRVNYRHYKGNLCEVIALSKLDSDPNITIVTYITNSGTVMSSHGESFFNDVKHNGVIKKKYVRILD